MLVRLAFSSVFFGVQTPKKNYFEFIFELNRREAPNYFLEFVVFFWVLSRREAPELFFGVFF